MFALVTILFLWHARGAAPPDKPACAAMTGLIALAVLLHGVWYFWALPVAAFFFARQFRWGAAFSVCWVAGVTLGAVATGQSGRLFGGGLAAGSGSPIGLHATQGTMVGELRPTPWKLVPAPACWAGC